MKRIFLGILLSLFVGNSAMAAPSTMGSSGVIDTPSADVLRTGQFSLGYFNLHESNNYTFNANIAKRLELGIARADYSHGDDDTYLNLKYSVHEEKIIIPGLAIGVEDITDERDATVYAVMSKSLPFGFRIHAGVGNGRYDGPFYAVEKTLFPAIATGVFPDTSLIVEHNGHDMNYGLRLSLAAGLKLNAGWRDDETYVAMTYNFY